MYFDGQQLVVPASEQTYVQNARPALDRASATDPAFYSSYSHADGGPAGP